MRCKRKMNRKRLVLVIMAVVAVGIFALPGTVSLFSGQHAWYDISSKTWEDHTTVPCKKCHADVAEEMASRVAPHTEAKTLMFCEDCHRVFFNYSASSVGSVVTPKYRYASGLGEGATAGVEAHAASTVECMDCHGLVGEYGGHTAMPSSSSPYSYGQDCFRCHIGFGDKYAFVAGGFNLTKGIGGGPFGFDPADDTGEHAAHKNFVLDAMDNPKMEGANEACIGCHTGIPVKITWTHGKALEFNASYDKHLELPPTHFNTSNYNATGNVTVTSYGNWSGGANMSNFTEPVTIWG